jgi:predicted lipoprotein
MKIYKYGVIVSLLGMIVYSSVNIRRLDEVKANTSDKEFDIESYVHDFWDTKLLDAKVDAVDINVLVSGLKNNPESTLEMYGKQLGISKVHYFMTKGKGVISSITEDYIEVDVGEGSVHIATDFIFGNAVRDASGKVDINEFLNLMDFNMVSVAINKHIRKNIIPQLIDKAVKNASIEIVGAVEVNEENIENLVLTIIPIQSVFSDDRITR